MTCLCGQTFNVQTENVGCDALCPKCGSRLVIPALNSTLNAEQGTDPNGSDFFDNLNAFDELIDTSDELVTTTARARNLKKGTTSMTSRTSKPLAKNGGGSRTDNNRRNIHPILESLRARFELAIQQIDADVALLFKGGEVAYCLRALLWHARRNHGRA